MENNNTDWMAVQTQVPNDTGFADIYNMGVDPSSVTLDTKESYKTKAKIKENPAFITNGKFDDKKFDQYYNMSVETLNAYKTSDFSVGSGNIPEMNLWEDTVLAKTLKQKVYKDPITIKLNKDPLNNLRIAQKSNLGFIDINQWSNPEKSIAEVAQGQKVIDGITGKELNFTAEDNGGLFNAFGFFDEPLVLSAYDVDIKDSEGNITHKKGETKFDEKGLPRYETLAGRSASGKQILSRMDTLTKEDSYLNKFDVMDSDDISKSIGGSIVKNAIQLLPLALGGPVGVAARAYFIADGLLQAGAEISKSLIGITQGKDADKGAFYKALNSTQAFTKQWKGSVSETSKNNFFTFENILGLASDSVYQLMGQQAIAQWPMRIKQYQIAKSLNLNPSLMRTLTKEGDEVLGGITKIENFIAKYGMDQAKIAIALSKNQKQLENIAKYSSYGATAFMSATSAVGISDVADNAGLDARDKGLLYLGYMSSLAPLFRMNIGKWVEGGHEIDDLAKSMNAAIKSGAQKEYTAVVGEATIAKNAATQATLNLAAEEVKSTAKSALTGLAALKGKGVEMLLTGKRLGAKVAAKFENITTPGAAALAEGLEEISEEMLQDGLKVIYNGLSNVGLTSTKNKKIDINLSDAMSRYGQAFIGGAVGGFVFKFVDPEIKVKHTLSDDMNEYVAAGHGNTLIDMIKVSNQNGELPGSKTLSINRLVNADGIADPDVWSPVNADNPVSQSDFIADRMIKEVLSKMEQMKRFGLENPDAFTSEKNKFYDTLIDTRSDTDLRDRLAAVSNKIVDLTDDIASIDDDSINIEVVKKKKEELKLAHEEFAYLTSDASVDEYFIQGLFNLNTTLTSKFGVQTRDSIAKKLIKPNSTYALLKGDDKTIVDNTFQEYRISNNEDYGMRSDLRKARLNYIDFDNRMKEFGYDKLKNFADALTTLAEAERDVDQKTYVVTGKVKIGDQVTENSLFEIANDFYKKMEGVAYIPDFLHDKITSIIENVKENHLTQVIEDASPGISLSEVRKVFIDNGIVNLTGDNGIQKAFKDYLTKLNPNGLNVVDSELIKRVNASGQSATLSDMIKLLGQVNDIKDDSAEKAIYDKRQAIIDSLTPEEAQAIIANVGHVLDYSESAQNEIKFQLGNLIVPGFVIDPELIALFDEVDLETILKVGINEDEGGPILRNPIDSVYLLSNLNKQSFLTTVLNQKYAVTLGGLIVPTNIIIEHALDGTLNKQGFNIDQLVKVDSEIDNLVVEMEKSLREKATSPLAEFLANTIEFKDRQFKVLNNVGIGNYINLAEDFDDTIDAHIDAVGKIAAYLEAVTYMNPRIKAWREAHKDIVPKELQKEELTTMSLEAYSTIYQTANILTNELEYLKNLNIYNKNNTLARLLREDGTQLASIYKTLVKISEIDNIDIMLPSLRAFIDDPTVKDYAIDIDAGTNEQKIEALGAAAKHEANIYKDFANLNPDVKQQLIDLTFFQIDPATATYRSAIDPKEALNDMHQTLYLAKIYGTSSINYTRAIAGFEDPQNLTKYIKISDAKMDPFPNQDDAIRLAYFNRNADPIVKAALAHAFEAKNSEGRPTTFKVETKSTIDTSSVITVLGDPGAGKTKVVMATILSLDEAIERDSVMLARHIEHATNLIDGVEAAGFGARINENTSGTISSFLTKLELVDIDNKPIVLSLDTAEILAKLDKTSVHSYQGTMDDDEKLAVYLGDLTDSIMDNVYLSDNGVFNPLLAEKLNGIRNIFIDEYTQANPLEIAILIKIVSEYNKTLTANRYKKINITLTGDNNQLGFEVEGNSRTFSDFVTTTTSVPLTVSLRSGKDLINNTLTEIKQRSARIAEMSNTQVKDPLTASHMFNVPITLNHTSLDGMPIGFFNQVVSGETTAEDLKFLTANLDAIKSSPNSLVYIVSDDSAVPAAEALLSSELGSDWRTYASVYTTTKVQGREFKYAIVDAGPGIENGNRYALSKVYRFLNTMASRATEATLLIDRGQYDNYVQFVQKEVPKAIEQKHLNDEILTAIKANRQAIAHAKLNSAEEELPPTGPNTQSANVPPTGPDNPNEPNNSNFTSSSNPPPDPNDIENIIARLYAEIADIEESMEITDSGEESARKNTAIDAIYAEIERLNNPVALESEPVPEVESEVIAPVPEPLPEIKPEDLPFEPIPEAPAAPKLEESVPGTGYSTPNAEEAAKLSAPLAPEIIVNLDDQVAPVVKVLSIDDTNALLNDQKRLAEQKTDLADEISETRPYLVNAYTSFTYRRDVAAINDLLQKPIKLTDEEAEGELMYLREKLSYGNEFGRNYFANNDLLNALENQGYNLRDLSIRIKATKRTPEFFAVGRNTWNNDWKDQPQNVITLIEGLIPNSNPNVPPFVFTVGFLNSIANIKLKTGSNVSSVNKFINAAEDGIAKKGIWISPEFSFKEWTAMTMKQEVKVAFSKNSKNKVLYYALRKNYRRNLKMTDPQSIIALPGSNLDILQWQKLSGKTVAFITEHASLRGKSPNDLYTIYANQIKNFNSPEYKAMTIEEKQAFVKGLPKIAGTTLSPRPRLVTMIELDNPRHNFMKFVTNYNMFVIKTKQDRASGKKVNLKEEVNEFEMSPYVADRFVKSLLVIHRMLTDENSTSNRAFFEENVLSKVKGNVLARIDGYMAETVASEIANGNTAFDFSGFTGKDLVSSETDAFALRTTDEFVAALEQFLFNNDKLVTKIYRTDSSTAYRTKGVDADTNVDMRNILPSELTANKNVDFGNGVLAVKNLTIYNKLKPSFLELIDATLILMGSDSVDKSPALKKYSLKQVFKDGLIESFVIAGVSTNGRHSNNVIAPVLSTSLSRDFTTNVSNIQPSAYYVDFDNMMGVIDDINTNGVQNPKARTSKVATDNITGRKTLIEFLNAFGANANDYLEYSDLIANENAPKTMLEFSALKTKGFILNLKPSATIKTVNQHYKLDTNNPASGRFIDSIDKLGLIGHELNDYADKITVVADYPDRFVSHTFDKKNAFNHTEFITFKNSDIFEPKDEAKKLIDSQGLTKEKVIEETKAKNVSDALNKNNNTVAKDFSKLKGHSVAIIQDGVIETVVLETVSIGDSGNISDSFITVSKDGLIRKPISMLNFIAYYQNNVTLPGADEVLNLENHPRAESKVVAKYDNPANLDFETTLLSTVEKNYPTLDKNQQYEIFQHALKELDLISSNPLTESTDGKEVRSNYDKLQVLINSPKTLIINPWASSVGENEKIDNLVEAYNNLAKESYKDSLHIANGFVNNFSIFADDSWLNQQAIIDIVLDDPALMKDPQIRENIMNLDAQLNKLTNDC